MPAVEFPQRDDAFLFLDAARKKFEVVLNCTIIHDREITEEAILEAERGFSTIPGVPHPNHFKVAGQIAFWIRKLKPFRIFRFSTFVDYLGKKGLNHQFPPEITNRDGAGHPLHLFVNEMIAVDAAFGYIRANGVVVRPKPELVHDLVMSLRYHSFSPNAVRIIIEGMA